METRPVWRHWTIDTSGQGWPRFRHRAEHRRRHRRPRPARVWEVMSDAEGWPTWTTTVARVTLLDGGLVGTRAAIEQPHIPRTVWTVTSLDEGHEFVWEAKGLGFHAIARHRIGETGPDRSPGHAIRRAVGMDRLRHGPLLPSASPAATSPSNEAAGLKARSEAG